MYRGFNLKMQDDFDDQDLITGYKLFEYSKKIVEESFDNFFMQNGSLDGNKIIENWFPNLPCHVFLSHSRKDLKLAIQIAGRLYTKLNIVTFIDSLVWLHCNDLLKKLDEIYCKNTPDSSYSYERRNYSTAHVHLMLSTSLNKMIDTAECVFFLNSPNSISTQTELTQHTNSPWIFSEIATTKIIQKKTPVRLQKLTKAYSSTSLNENVRAQLNIEYELELSHLTELTKKEFFEWTSTYAHNPNEALDNLYQQHPINPKFID